MFLQSYNILAKEVMAEDFIIVKEDTSIDKIINILIKNVNKEIFVVNKVNRLVGIITLKDLKDIYQNSNKRIRNCIYKDIIYVKPEDSLLNCRDIMVKKNIGRLPVIKNSKVIGVIRQEHIRNYLYMRIEKIGVILKYILKNINEAICVVDDKGKVVIWNNNAEKLYGISASEIKGKYLQDYFPDAVDVEIIKTRKAVKNIYHTPKEGCHIIISATPIYINGKFIGVVSTDRDVSEVKKMQSELKMTNDIIEFLQKEINKHSNNNFGGVIGKSKIMQEKIEMAKQVAKTNASILIVGESGTGKEVFARAIHDYSGAKGYFVPVNCSAIPNELFESEFFGYEEGAFTGAKRTGKKGLFELANNGTIFLDEIGDLPLFMQAKLLRVLQDKEIKKIGGEKSLKLNFRVISATNKNLQEMVKEDKFREDLYYRINVIKLELPPLRDRKEDIILLLNHFLKIVCSENNCNIPKVDNEVVDMLIKYDWKGNTRELKNAIEHMVVLNRNNIIKSDLIPQYIRDKVIDEDDIKNICTNNGGLHRTVENYEKSLIKQALKISGGNKVKTAVLLNIPRTTLQSKIKRYKI